MNSHLKTATNLTHILENQFQIGRFKFGLDPILGLIPGGGDLITAILSFYIVWIGIQMHLPGHKITQMISNIVVDFLLGLIPILGDASDFIFKANTKNLKILHDFAPTEFYEGEEV
jgi:hypothetical protein